MPCSFPRLPAVLRALRERKEGAVTVIFAIAATVLIIAVGMGIDLWRAYVVKARLQAALDAGALAIGSTNPADFTTAEMQQRLQQFFTANYPATALGTPATPSMTYGAGSGDNVINVTATATVPTTFMPIVGIDNLTVNAQSQVTRGISGLELALVLDNTGSMFYTPSGSGTNNITALKADATEIINTLFASSADTTKLKIAIVPFVTAVNPGLTTIVSWPLTDQEGHTLFDPAGNALASDFTSGAPTPEWKGCVVEPNISTNQDISEPSGGWTGPWYPYYWSNVYPDVWSKTTTYTTNNVVSYSNKLYQSLTTNNKNYQPNTNPTKWTASLTPGKATSQAQDGDNPWTWNSSTNNFDYPANASSDTSCLGLGGGPPVTATTKGPNMSCPTPVTQLTDNQTTLLNAVSAMQAWCRSGTMIQVGAIWGWRALSPNPPYADGQPYNTPGWVKAAVIETDGTDDLNDLTAYGTSWQSDLSGYGRVTDGLLGVSNASEVANQSDARLGELCTNMKAAGINIFAIAFSGSGTSVSPALQDCAGPGAGSTVNTTWYFAPDDQASLQSAFQQIATSLNNLRLSQ